LQTTELFEKDFSRARVERGLRHPQFGEGLRVSGTHRGLRLSQEIHWSTLRVAGRDVLRLARRALVKIEQALFTAPENVRILALTRWGGLAKDESYELSLNMGWHHHRSMREKGRWGYFAWNTPYMFDADGPSSEHEGYMPANVHCMGLAEYTVLSWPRQNYAVMAAIDPVEYLERNINTDSWPGAAQASFIGWYEPTDVGAEYATPWQHYYFLDDEANPLVASTTIWREGYAPRLNPHLQPEEELEPWFTTENLYGPRYMTDWSALWDGDMTALAEHYAALRRDPLDSQVHPILMHERPGFGVLGYNGSRFYDYVHQKTPVGRILINVPLSHRVGDRATITCVPLFEPGKLDIKLELELTGACFRLEGVALVPFSFGKSGADIPPERVQVRQDDKGIAISLAHSAAALKKDFAALAGYTSQIEVRFRVMEKIPAADGILHADFYYRQPGETEYTRHKLTDEAEVTRGRFKFPPEPYPIQLKHGEAQPGYFPVGGAYKVPSIFYDVKDGRPVRIPPGEFLPRMARLMKDHDIAITTYISSHGIQNYEFGKNPNWLIPNALALDQNRKIARVWYLDGNRADRLCPVCEEHNKYLDEGIRRLLALGPFGVYFDEIHGNFVSCYSRDHGHGLCQDTMLAHRRGERIRQVARAAGDPAMYMGTEVGGLLQHLYAQGHNFEGVDPSWKEKGFEEVKRLLLGQLCYGFPGSRAFFNYCFVSGQPKPEYRADSLFGHALGLAFPRFSLATWGAYPTPIGYYFAAAVKKAFKEHYRYGATEFPEELVRPGAAPLETLGLALKSKAGLSVHFANVSGKQATLSGHGYTAALGHNCALLADSFGNCMGQAQALQFEGADYLRFDRPVAFGLWRTAEGAVYLRVLEADQTELRSPAQAWLSKTLLDRLAPGKTLAWRALDKESAAKPVETRPDSAGGQLVFPAGAACRCLRAE
jgi:hypothetical protein